MKPKILIVDDEPDVLKTTGYVLASEGYQIHTVASGEECLEKIDEVKPDLLLLDLKLPGKSGFQIAKEIRAKEAFKDIPIIVMSAMTEASSKHIAAKDGVMEYIEKPIDLDKLKFHIKDLLKRER